jgi:hypothetical protein
VQRRFAFDYRQISEILNRETAFIGDSYSWQTMAIT